MKKKQGVAALQEAIAEATPPRPRNRGKRKPPHRGRASQVPVEAAAQVGNLVAWRPRMAAEGTWVLCICTNVRFRYGNWDFELLPVAGGGVAWAEAAYVAPAPVSELNPAQLIADLERRIVHHYQGDQDDHQHPGRQPEAGFLSPQAESRPEGRLGA